MSNERFVKAWFPTAEACDTFGMPSFEGFVALQEALDTYQQTEQNGNHHWELLNISDVEGPTVVYRGEVIE